MLSLNHLVPNHSDPSPRHSSSPGDVFTTSRLLSWAATRTSGLNLRADFISQKAGCRLPWQDRSPAAALRPAIYPAARRQDALHTVLSRRIPFSSGALHSINGFFCPATKQRPRVFSDSRSFASTIARAGNIGLLGSTCDASLAACSMASISSLQACWSMGQMTSGCLTVRSLVELSCACVVL